MIKIAACVKDGIVVNTAVYDEDTSQSWLEAVKPDYDEIIITDEVGIGYTYDKDRDAFIPPKPFDSWILDEETYKWESPIPYPNDEQEYIWNDNQGVWEIIGGIQ
jgi:hypothetical protein